MLFIIDPDSGVCDLDLAGAHGLEGGLVLGGRYAGAAGSVAGDGRLGKGGFDQQGVGYDTDIGAQTDQFDLDAFLFALLEDLHEFGELRAAEGGLVDDVVRVDQFRDVGADLPAIGSANAVGDRKIFALLGGQVEIAVSVTRGKDVFLGVGLYFGLDVVDDGDCFGRSESAVDKIVLHIDHK